VAPTTTAGLIAAITSLAFGLGGAGLVRHARAIPAPGTPVHRVLPGTVTELLATPCSQTRRHRGTCFRPLVAYTDGGRAMQVVSETHYRPPPYQKDDRVDVFVEANGTAWHAREWQDRRDERQRQYEQARELPLTMGWILVGCGAFGLLLGAGLIFFVDRSDPQLG
jgi:hypothetical protein